MNTDAAGVLVVIVNYRTAALVRDCLESLAPELGAQGARVVVADNASGDGSAEQIAAAIGGLGLERWVSVMALERNGGFAWGNNQVIRADLASPRPAELYFLLNPDTVARPGAVGVLARFLRSHPRAGIAGSRLEYPDGRPQPAAFRAPGLLAELENALSLRPVSRVLRSASVLLPQPVNPIRPDWVSGAAMMVRREVFERVGLLDERYFMYFEELDLCERAGRAGFEVWHVPESRVVHLIGQASGIGRERRRRPAYWFESRRRYWVKNHGVAGAAAADAVRIAGTALHRAGLKVRGRPNWMPPGFLRDLVRHSVFVRGFRT